MNTNKYFLKIKKNTPLDLRRPHKSGTSSRNCCCCCCYLLTFTDGFTAKCKHTTTSTTTCKKEKYKKITHSAGDPLPQVKEFFYFFFWELE